MLTGRHNYADCRHIVDDVFHLCLIFFFQLLQVVPSGLAAQDGRLRKGDIIQQVMSLLTFSLEIPISL